MISTVIPKAEEYLHHNLNLLIIGKHGTGKTESVLQLAEAHNLNMKYYSCSTLDPYTDLVGVPVPHTDTSGKEYLKMIRPLDIDEAEFIFFDEFNRADRKTHNAIFEIIQFRTINGEPLPKLRCCWAAMNPPELDYQVEDIDQALIDRFDLFVTIDPQPSIAYMSKFMDPAIAEALHTWWSEKHEHRNGEYYISPRRLMKMGILYQKTNMVRAGLPPWGDYDLAKLTQKLRAAKGEADIVQGGLGSGASSEFGYTPQAMKQHREELISYLQQHPNELETHKAVLRGLDGVTATRLVYDYANVLQAIAPASLAESFILGLRPSKRSKLQDLLRTLARDAPERAQEFEALTTTVNRLQ